MMAFRLLNCQLDPKEHGILFEILENAFENLSSLALMWLLLRNPPHHPPAVITGLLGLTKLVNHDGKIVIETGPWSGLYNIDTPI